MKTINLMFIGLSALLVDVHANMCAGLSDGAFVKNPEGDCQDFVVCFDGVSHARRCPTGFFFDEDLQMCNYWDEVLCGDPTDPCYGKPQFVFIARPAGSCSSYYRCEYGVGVPLDCHDGFFFDELNQMCNFPEEVDCVDPIIPTLPTPPTPSPTTSATTELTAPTPPPTTPSPATT